MGAKMGQKLTSSKPGFQPPISMSNITEVYWRGLGALMSPWWGRMCATG